MAVWTRVPKPLRRQLQARADRYARRTYGSEIDALQAQRSQVRRQYRRDVRSLRGATNYAQRQIGDIMSDLPDNLRGRYAAQTTQALASQRAGIAQQLPLLVGEARTAKRDAMAGIQDDILSTKIQQQKSAAEKLYSLMSNARTDLEQEAKDGKGGRHFDRSEVLDAIALLQQYSAEPKAYTKKHPLTSYVRGEGVSPHVAQSVLETYAKYRPVLGEPIAGGLKMNVPLLGTIPGLPPRPKKRSEAEILQLLLRELGG